MFKDTMAEVGKWMFPIKPYLSLVVMFNKVMLRLY